MTCIVGIIENGKVYMGADSAGVAGLDITRRKDAKVFHNGEFLIGYTSSFRMGQLLRFKFKPPEYRPDKKDLYEYMCTDFVEAVRKCFKDGGYARKNNEEESAGCFLVGAYGRLFQLESDYQIGESINNYDSIGCGANYAKGALFVIDRENYEPEDKIKRALLAASEHSAGVCGPFEIIKEAK